VKKFLLKQSRWNENVLMETFSRGTLDPWYVTGFVEGEGVFTYSRSGRQMGLYFAIKLPDADRPLLERVQDFFGGIGKIYQVGAGAATPRTGLTRTASYFRVTRRDELEHVVAHFDAYPLRGTKAGCYAIWRQMVLIKREFRRPARPQLDELAARLTAASPRNGGSRAQPDRRNGARRRRTPAIS
jgi:hypothetical protein